MSTTPDPLPSPLAYPNAVSRPTMAPRMEQTKARELVIAGLMALTGCSRTQARQALAMLLKLIEEGRNA